MAEGCGNVLALWASTTPTIMAPPLDLAATCCPLSSHFTGHVPHASEGMAGGRVTSPPAQHDDASCLRVDPAIVAMCPDTCKKGETHWSH